MSQSSQVIKNLSKYLQAVLDQKGLEERVEAIDQLRKSFKFLILKDRLLVFDDLTTLDVRLEEKKSVKECQQFVSKKLNAFIDLLKSFVMTKQTDEALRMHSIKLLIELSCYRIKSFLKVTTIDAPKLYEDTVLRQVAEILLEQDEKGLYAALTDYIQNYKDFLEVYFNTLNLVFNTTEISEEKYCRGILHLIDLLPSIDEEISSMSLFFTENEKAERPVEEEKQPQEKQSKFLRTKRMKALTSTDPYIDRCKQAVEDCIKQLIGSKSLDKDLLLLFLQKLSKKVFPNIKRPLILANFLLNHFEKDPLTDVGIWSLSNLFFLIVKHSFEYPGYYDKLYKIISNELHANEPTLFKSTSKEKFFKLLENSFRSSRVGATISASFIKLFARLCYKAPVEDILWFEALIFNMLKKYIFLMFYVFDEFTIYRDPVCEGMIQEPKTTESVKDPYQADVSDPKFTKALSSKLWELKSLKNHYCSEIRELSGAFEDFPTANPFELNDFLGLDRKSMIANKIAKAKKTKQRVAISQEESPFPHTLKGLLFDH